MTEPRAGEESTEMEVCKCGHTREHHVLHDGVHGSGFCTWDKPFQKGCDCQEFSDETYTEFAEERAGREATEPAKLQADADTVARMHAYLLLSASVNGHTKVANEFLSKILFDWSSLKAQLAAQPSVQRDEDGIGWCSSCDKIHEVVRPKCPSCGDWLIFAADDKPEDSAKSFNDGVKAATDYLRGMHNMETLAFLTEKTVLRITAERGSK